MNRMEDSLSHLGCKLGLKTPAHVLKRGLTDIGENPGDQGGEQSTRNPMERPSFNDQDSGETKMKPGKPGRKPKQEE